MFIFEGIDLVIVLIFIEVIVIVIFNMDYVGLVRGEIFFVYGGVGGIG